jgi:hypothetical protein
MLYLLFIFECCYATQIYVCQQKQPYCICVLRRVDLLPEDDAHGVETWEVEILVFCYNLYVCCLSKYVCISAWR